jgi:hypothetical protein
MGFELEQTDAGKQRALNIWRFCLIIVTENIVDGKA